MTPCHLHRRVLHARTITGAGGGPEKTILNSPRFLRTLGYDGICLYLHPPIYPELARLSARASQAEAELVAVPDQQVWNWSFVRRLARLCQQKQIAIWHAHDYKTNFLGILIQRFWPMKLVTTCHGWIYKRGLSGLRVGGYNSVGKLCLRFYDRVICVSQDLVDDALKWFVPASRLRLVHNAIDTQQYRRSRSPSQARELLGIPPALPLVVGIGRLSPEKGFADLVQAVDQLHRRQLDRQGLHRKVQGISLRIAGEGDCRAALARQLSSSTLCDQNVLMGHIGDPRTLLEAADIFVLSSISEGLPNVLLESLAMQTAVVATRVAEVPSVIRHEREGLLSPVGNAAVLSEHIDRLLCDANLRHQLAANGLKRVQNDFDFSQRMKNIASIYDQLLATASEGIVA